MKRIKKTVLTLLLISIFVFLYGCSKNTVVDESWAYNFDKTTEILKLKPDGTATYVIKSYENGKQVKLLASFPSYIKDDQFITLKDKENNELKLRYNKTDAGIDLYEKNEYAPAVRKSETGIAGVWVDVNCSDYFFEFTEDGTFLEDGYFTGKYTLDEKEGKINFTYDGDSSQAVLYYTLEGDSLYIEYPWPMVPTEKASK